MGTVDGSTIRAERVDYGRMIEAIDRVGDRFIAQLRGLEPSAGDRKVPDLTWTVAEVAVHMLNIVNRGLGDRRRADSVAALAELNQRCVDETDVRTPAEISDRLERDKTTLLGILRGQTPEEADRRTFPLHAGLVTNVTSALSYMLFDFLAHGLDIARGTERNWQIDPGDAALDLHACLPVLGPWADVSVMSGPVQRQAISFPGDEDAIVLEVGEGEYRAQNYSRAATADVYEVDPVATFLAIAGREPSTDPVASRLARWFIPI